MKNVIRVSQLKLKPDESEKKLKNMIIHTLKLLQMHRLNGKYLKSRLMQDINLIFIMYTVLMYTML